MIKNFSKPALAFLLTVGVFFFSVFFVHAQEESTRKRIIIDGEEFFLHVVQVGEGFYSIARQYNVSQQEILDANPQLEGGLLKGQILRIPVIEGRNANSKEVESSGNFTLHTVEKGQTVWFISRKYDVDIEDIYKHNPGSRQKLTVGSIIKVPVSGEQEKTQQFDDDNFKLYEIKAGDTLYSLSRRVGTSVNDILQLNPGLRSGVLVVGSVIRIPSGQEPGERKDLATKDEPGYIEGERYNYHEIKPGQTLYSISRLYQVEVDELRRVNPDINPDDLKPGYMLRIPRSVENRYAEQQEVKDRDMFETHKVRRRETLFSISRRYDVDMEIIRKVNAGVNFSNLRRGTELKIPTDQWFVLNYPGTPEEGRETAESGIDSVKYSGLVPSDSLCINKNNVGSVLRPVRVALLLPFDLDATEKANIVEKVQNGDTIKTVRQNPVLARRSVVFVEFYEGALLALDKLKQENVNVELSVFDIASENLSVKDFLDANERELSKVDMIIGPARSENLKPVSDFALNHQIKLVYPLSNVNPELERNPWLFQINTPDTLVFDKMAAEIVRQSENYNLLAILPEEEDEYASRFIEQLRKKVFFNEFALNKNINYLEYRIVGNEDQTNLEALLDPLKRNYVVVPTNQEATISKIVPTLAGIAETHGVPIHLFGMTEWLRAQSIEPEDMFRLNASIFTFFAFDYDNNQTKRFIEKYRDWYYTEPHAVSPYFQNSSSSPGYSRYGAWGYDVTYYFISALARRGLHFEYCPDPINIQPVQFNFSFKRISNWGGFYNEGIFLLKFLQGYKVKRVPLLTFPSVLPVTAEESFH